MCELLCLVRWCVAESHMQMLLHHTRLQRRDGRLLLRLTRQFRCPGPTARRTASGKTARPAPWISSAAQPGGTVCTDVRCFTGTLSACWTYRQSTSARSHVRDRLRMHAYREVLLSPCPPESYRGLELLVATLPSYGDAGRRGSKLSNARNLPSPVQSVGAQLRHGESTPAEYRSGSGQGGFR